jgi:predicted aspartyl protease
MECYNCKGPHRARDCPKPRAECFNCKQRGHSQRKCPFKRRPNDGSRKVTGDRGENEVVQEDKETRNPYIMSVVLKGRKFKCLVDTGSSCTIIRRGVAEKLKLKKDEDKSVLRDFAGKVTTSAGS